MSRGQAYRWAAVSTPIQPWPAPFRAHSGSYENLGVIRAIWGDRSFAALLAAGPV